MFICIDRNLIEYQIVSYDIRRYHIILQTAAERVEGAAMLRLYWTKYIIHNQLVRLTYTNHIKLIKLFMKYLVFPPDRGWASGRGNT